MKPRKLYYQSSTLDAPHDNHVRAAIVTLCTEHRHGTKTVAVLTTTRTVYEVSNLQPDYKTLLSHTDADLFISEEPHNVIREAIKLHDRVCADCTKHFIQHAKGELS